ncbi:MAG: phenylalanine--tRNA ligase subunit beta [Firmicutes bacterium]|nr:phenylalanine--tRNA ligase subunit beta [Bacillota bacterium]
MRVSYRWLNEYIDVTVSATELAEKLTRAGLEVAEVAAIGAEVSGVVAAKVLTCEDHPKSDHLHICTVDDASGAPVQVVCGAANVAAGQTIAFARVGATLPGGINIGKAKLAGTESFGMICSQKELGLSEDHSGIWVLDGLGLEPGDDVLDKLNLRDEVLDIELTPNRSDCLGMLNVAHEVAALIGGKVKEDCLDYIEAGENAADLISIEVLDEKLCPRYDARLVRGVKIGPSPLWMQNYLLAAGMRPINNVVDISNFVMLERNQPLHTFDYATLAGKKIIVRCAAEGEQMQTLDGKDRTFRGEEILICDAEKPICVAGVMGGMETEVTDKTTDILIESACFNPVAIRRAARHLGIPSEASLRFEKGVDIAACDAAARRAAQLLVKYAGGTADKGNVDVSVAIPAEKVVRLRTAYVGELLGIYFTAAEIGEVMDSLGFKWEADGDAMLVHIPSYRQDISIPADLVEEVARLRGIDNLPATIPVNQTQGKRPLKQQFICDVQEFCAGLGLYETVNYSFISPRDWDKLRIAGGAEAAKPLAISNPLNEEQSLMRQSLLPGLLGTTSRNYNRRNLSTALFEVGNVFFPQAEKAQEVQPEEKAMLGIVLSGKTAASWQGGAAEYDYFYLKGLLEALLPAVGVREFSFRRADAAAYPFLHPGRCAELVVDGTCAGWLGEVHPLTAEAYEIGQRVVACDIELQVLLDAVARPKLTGLPKYPAATRDIAVIGSREVAVADIEAAIRKAGGDILAVVSLFDVYEGAPIVAGQRSLAFSLTFRLPDRTLTDAEVDGAFTAIVTALKDQFDYTLR